MSTAKDETMITNIDKLTKDGCAKASKDKVCRSRGGESCAFDGAMIVLQPIGDTAHLVHGPIACCGNSWEGRGTRSSRADLFRMGFTTDMNELDIVYGAEGKLSTAIRELNESVRPKAIFVHATCVSGLIGEDIEAVCRQAEEDMGIRVIPVNAPGFVGPKNLGNRIAGEVLLDHVIGTGEPPPGAAGVINLIGEYNVAGDLWLVEPALKKAGIGILSRITGDSSFEEITYAHRAALNVVVCSRALINVATGMEREYGIPFVEVSFFGKTEMAKALRLISSQLEVHSSKFKENVENVIGQEEIRLQERLRDYEHLIGKRAVLYTGGVKSWSFISAIKDLGMEVVAVGTKKSTFEDEEKMRDLLGPDAPLVEDVTPKNLKALLKERNADVLIAGGRNQYLAVKEGYPFVDVNQERHTAYAGYDGLINLAEQISNGITFYARSGEQRAESERKKAGTGQSCAITIDPLKHSASIGAAIAFQGIHRALPVIHGAQGCTFLGKVLLTRHFREPIALAGTKIFAEDVVMGSDERLTRTVTGFIEKDRPDVIGVLTTGLTEVKGDDIAAVVKSMNLLQSGTRVVAVPTPDYEAGLEKGYASAVEALVALADDPSSRVAARRAGQLNVLAGHHLTPADFFELREVIESFGLTPVLLPDLAALDGSRQGISPLAVGGAGIQEILAMAYSQFTIAIGSSMERAAQRLHDLFGIPYRVFGGVSGLDDTDLFMESLQQLSGRPLPRTQERMRRVLIDTMRDAHFYTAGKKVCVALEPDHAFQTSRWLSEMAANIPLVIVPTDSPAASLIQAEKVIVGSLADIEGEPDLIISNSHAADRAARLNVPLLHAGFPSYKVFGASRVTVGYRGTAALIRQAAEALAGEDR
jgi:nitrogenase molybdenum-cofactor synthesis protein NifE